MFRRGAFFFLVLTAAVGIPYFSSEWGKVGQLFGGSSTHQTSSDTVTPADAAIGLPPSAAPSGDIPSSATAIAGMPGTTAANDLVPIVDLNEALRFDVTNAWILGHWPRVTAGLPDADLQGYRVPLVTGVGEDDLAGSLTYYFTREQHCRRITLQATTGDARKLINLLTSRYGFIQQTSTDPSLYLYQIRWNGRPTSELQVRPARVVRANAALARFDVVLAMNDPNAK